MVFPHLFGLFMVKPSGTIIAFDGYYYYPKATVIARYIISHILLAVHINKGDINKGVWGHKYALTCENSTLKVVFSFVALH